MYKALCMPAVAVSSIKSLLMPWPLSMFLVPLCQPTPSAFQNRSGGRQTPWRVATFCQVRSTSHILFSGTRTAMALATSGFILSGLIYSYLDGMTLEDHQQVNSTSGECQASALSAAPPGPAPESRHRRGAHG